MPYRKIMIMKSNLSERMPMPTDAQEVPDRASSGEAGEMTEAG